MRQIGNEKVKRHDNGFPCADGWWRNPHARWPPLNPIFGCYDNARNRVRKRAICWREMYSNKRGAQLTGGALNCTTEAVNYDELVKPENMIEPAWCKTSSRGPAPSNPSEQENVQFVVGRVHRHQRLQLENALLILAKYIASDEHRICR